LLSVFALNIPLITVDGPVASGKGTIARKLAAALNFHLLDSGAIYRAHAQACLIRQVNFNKINELTEEARVLSLKFVGEQVWLDGADATAAIRSEAVGMAASTLSAIPEVRAALMQRQRDFLQAPGLVADGRDMGTVVFPQAMLKIYLTATAEVRAARRALQIAKQQQSTAAELVSNSPAKQLIEKGNSPILMGSLETMQAQLQLDTKSVEQQIRQRDLQDKSRKTAPLKPAIDAIVIDNAAHTPEETVDAVLKLWQLRVLQHQAS
jgi:cytidylate kinase